jgi:small subunit ribosomal protein S11
MIAEDTTAQKPLDTDVPVVATTEEVKPKTTSKKKKIKRSVPYGQIHVNATFNNTIVTFTDKTGSVLTQSSAGACGFRGSKKGTAYAAQIAAEKAGSMAKQQYGLSKVDAIIRGVGQGRETAVRALINLDIAVESMKDVTPTAHGGTRPKKARRN